MIIAILIELSNLLCTAKYGSLDTPEGMKVIKENKKAHLDYEVIESYDAGLVLTGSEVKSAKLGHIDLEGSYITLRPDGAWICGLKISRYQKSSQHAMDYKVDRNRRLLLQKRELLEIAQKSTAQGLTIIPLLLYTTPSLVKLRLAIARGRKKYDKRDVIKKREFQRRLNTRVR